MPWYAPWSDVIKKKVCRFVLQRYLGQFLEEKLSLDQLNVDFYNGTGTVYDVTLYCQVIICLTSLLCLLFLVSFFFKWCFEIGINPVYLSLNNNILWIDHMFSVFIYSTFFVELLIYNNFLSKMLEVSIWEHLETRLFVVW